VVEVSGGALYYLVIYFEIGRGFRSKKLLIKIVEEAHGEKITSGKVL